MKFKYSLECCKLQPYTNIVNSETCYFSFFMSTIFPLFASFDIDLLIMKLKVQTIKMYDRGDFEDCVQSHTTVGEL